jgi:hypothetical protein
MLQVGATRIEEQEEKEEEEGQKEKEAIFLCVKIYVAMFTYITEVLKIVFKMKTYLRQPINGFIRSHSM